jgi:hypothetical protein
MFRHASVGTTIDGGLNCLQGTKSRCTTYAQYKFDRRAWAFQIRGNSGWYGKINDFVSQVHTQINEFDVFAFKYCYLDGLDEVSEPCGKYPSNPHMVRKAWFSLRDSMNRLESRYPGKTFVYWTIPLTQVGQNCTEELNTLIRNYCRDNNKWLFDIADIESHDTLDNPVVNSQGWQKAFKPYCGEQKPDAQACHPNEFGGMILAKALWVNIALIAGWNPSSTEIVGNIAQLGFSISPIPATDFIDISYSPSIKMRLGGVSEEIKIYNYFGEKIINYEFQITNYDGNLKIDISDLPIGMYFIKIGNNTEKFMVVR